MADVLLEEAISFLFLKSPGFLELQTNSLGHVGTTAPSQLGNYQGGSCLREASDSYFMKPNRVLNM